MKLIALHVLAVWYYVVALAALWVIPPHLFFMRGKTAFTVSYFLIMYVAAAWFAPIFRHLAWVLQ